MVHTVDEVQSMWRSISKHLRYAAAYADKKDRISVQTYVDSANTGLMYLRYEEIEAASGACEVE